VVKREAADAFTGRSQSQIRRGCKIYREVTYSSTVMG
jgi:hypothetical protein